ncbi:MAG: pantoate--beta-alanine ligase [Bacteroidales bacterium]|nr:pantoate--beta-alanine ligase [Bacteroidales bacterium]MCF8403604.1 pantoate--beta-alanine ligase [Bacteroidales bacterium]
MKIFQASNEIKDYLFPILKDGKSIGFVPTMGALHEGHLSLITEAKEENNLVVCSIFVNPIQFNNKEDLKKYPRTHETDIQKLKSINCDVLFMPSEEEMYPEAPTETFDFEGLNKVLEGKFRPGHFEGVTIVVKRLFEIVNPTKAYFGIKDYQQMLIIHNQVKKLGLGVEIVPCSIIREENGLAMSSRNELLSPVERKQASILYETLKWVKIRSGFATIEEIKQQIRLQFKKNKFVELEYFEIVDMYTLKSLNRWAESNNIIACIAANVGNVRLIDNIILFS